VHSKDDAEAITVMTLAMQSAAEVSAAAHVPGRGTYLRLEGIAISVAARRDSLIKSLTAGYDCLAEVPSNAVWRDIRDCKMLAPTEDEMLWRISVPPSEGASVVAAVSAVVPCRYMFDWAGGLIWLVTPAKACENLRATLPSGQATLYASGQDMKKRIPVFHPQHPPLQALTERLKLAFDPLGKLNPGRMFPGV
jgi:glycolate oxidase FAD binding subunit